MFDTGRDRKDALVERRCKCAEQLRHADKVVNQARWFPNRERDFLCSVSRPRPLGNIYRFRQSLSTIASSLVPVWNEG